MNEKITLNNSVIYNEATAELYKINDENDRIVLTSPANNCLAIILRNRPNLTTQKELFEEVWEKHGLSVTANAYYQNISLVRRSLKLMGINEKTIITIPKKGVIFSEEINVEKIAFDDGIKNSESIAELKTVTDESSVKNHNNTIKEVFPTQKIQKLGSQVILPLVSLILAIVVSNILFYIYESKQSLLADYQQTDHYNGCNVYTSKTSPSSLSNDMKGIFDDIKLTCANEENVYLSSFPGLPRVSAILCNGDIIRPETQCRSNYVYLMG